MPIAAGSRRHAARASPSDRIGHAGPVANSSTVGHRGRPRDPPHRHVSHLYRSARPTRSVLSAFSPPRARRNARRSSACRRRRLGTGALGGASICGRASAAPSAPAIVQRLLRLKRTYPSMFDAPAAIDGNFGAARILEIWCSHAGYVHASPRPSAWPPTVATSATAASNRHELEERARQPAPQSRENTPEPLPFALGPRPSTAEVATGWTEDHLDG